MDLQNQLEESNAEKMALDQLYVECLKNSLQLKKQLILKNNELNKLIEKVNELQLKFEKQKSSDELLDDVISENTTS